MRWSLARAIFSVHIWASTSIHLCKANCPHRSSLLWGGECPFRICAHTFLPAPLCCQAGKRTRAALWRKCCNAGRGVVPQPFHCPGFCQGLQGWSLPCSASSSVAHQSLEMGENWLWGLVSLFLRVLLFQSSAGRVNTSAEMPTETCLQTKVWSFCHRFFWWGDKTLLWGSPEDDSLYVSLESCCAVLLSWPCFSSAVCSCCLLTEVLLKCLLEFSQVSWI